MSGIATAREIASAIRSFYAGDVTLYSLWDLRQGNIESTDDEVWNLARTVRTLNLSIRTGGKTALVAGEGAIFGLARTYQHIADTLNLPFDIRAFSDIEEAYDWLGRDVPTS